MFSLYFIVLYISFSKTILKNNLFDSLWSLNKDLIQFSIWGMTGKRVASKKEELRELVEHLNVSFFVITFCFLLWCPYI